MAADDDVHLRPFAEFLVKQRAGSLNVEAAERLAEVVAAVAETGKDGSMTLTIKVSRNKAGALEVTDKVVAKIPDFGRVPTLWWADDDGNLVRRDPNQPELFDGPKAVDDPANGDTPKAKRAQGGTTG